MLIRLIVVLCVMILTAGYAGAQPQTPGPYKDAKEVPATPAGARAKEVLEALNSGEPARIETYVRENFAPAFRDLMPIEEHVGQFLQARESGALKFHGFRVYKPARPPTQAVLVGWNADAERWQAVVVDVEPEEPHRIVSVGFNPARPPTDTPALPAIDQAGAARELRAFVERRAKADGFSGTFLIAKDGKILAEGAFGLADKGLKVPNTIDTKFNLGSMNKMFTATAIAQLVEKGKLSFSDPIGKYLGSDWVREDAGAKVTVHHLLTHTSGLGSYFNDQWDRASRALYRDVDDWKALVKDETLAFEPGTRWQYSNTGFLLLGAIVGKVSGQDYFEYLREHIYAPAGMTSSDCYALDEVTENLAVGYSKTRGDGGPRYTSNVFKHVIRGGPAGGGYSTVHDLLAFDRALRSGKLVSQKTLELLWSEKPEASSPTYGYGFAVQRGPWGKAVGHSGGFPGISANLTMFLDSGWTVAVMSNYDMAAENVADKGRELVGRVK